MAKNWWDDTEVVTPQQDAGQTDWWASAPVVDAATPEAGVGGRVVNAPIEDQQIPIPRPDGSEVPSDTRTFAPDPAREKVRAISEAASAPFKAIDETLTPAVKSVAGASIGDVAKGVGGYIKQTIQGIRENPIKTLATAAADVLTVAALPATGPGAVAARTAAVEGLPTAVKVAMSVYNKLKEAKAVAYPALRATGAQTAAGTAGEQADIALGINPNEKRGIAEGGLAGLGASAALNLTESALGQAGGTLLARTAQAVKPAAAQNLLQRTSDFDPTMTAKQAAERLGTNITSTEAVLGTPDVDEALKAVQYSRYMERAGFTQKSPLVRREMEQQKLFQDVVLGKGATSPRAPAKLYSEFSSRVKSLESNLKQAADQTEVAAFNAAKTDTARLKVDDLPSAVRDIEANIKGAFGEIDGNRIQDVVDRLYAKSTSDMTGAKQGVSAADYDSAMKQIASIVGDTPERRAVYFKDGGILDQMLAPLAAANTNYAKATLEALNARRAVFALTDPDKYGPVYKALTSGRERDAVKAFSTPDNYLKSVELFGKPAADQALRESFFNLAKDPKSTLQGFSAEGFKRAYAAIPDSVIVEAFGEELAKDYRAAYLLQQAKDSTGLLKIAVSPEMNDKQTLAIVQAAGRLTGATQIGGVSLPTVLGVDWLANRFGIGAKSLEKLSQPKAFEMMQNAAGLKMSDPAAYATYVAIARELGVRPITNEEFSAYSGMTPDEIEEMKANE